MTGDALPVGSAEHEHAWRLVSVETEDGGVQISERQCSTCSAVLIDGA